ncbi:MAG: NUDIX domain-containing protein [Ruminococcaceae bacterium]|nr:NUDIX domain-containing protein [Oscillospiraceae bacterium]
MRLPEKIRAFSPSNAQEAADQELMLQHLARYDDLLTRENPVMHFTASAWVVAPDREQVLMVYHNIYRSWSWTGGHADGEEDLLSVALREVREETGLLDVRPLFSDIFSLEILGVNAHVKRGHHVSTHLHLNATFLLEADPAQPLRVKPDENSAVAWIPAAEVIERSSEPDMQVVYRKLMEKLRAFPFDH